MSLGKKTLLIILMTLISSIAVLSIISKVIFTKGFAVIEERDTSRC